jgi:acetyl-CoA synthetase
MERSSTTTRGGVAARTRQIHADFQQDRPAVWFTCDRHDPDVIAFRFVGPDLVTRSQTYGELRARSERAAGILADHGVGPGDRVASLLGKGADLPALMLGVWRLGAVYVPLFTAFAADTVAQRVEDAQVKVVVTDANQVAKTAGVSATVLLANTDQFPTDATPTHDFTAALESGPRHTQACPVSGPETPLVHIFTSGTTGKPKSVVHPLSHLAGWQSYLEHGLAPGKTYWSGADPGWAFGLYTVIAGPLAAGVTSIVTEGTFDASATWRVLSELEVTDFAGAPTVYRAMRAADPGTELPHLRGLSSAGEPLTPDVGEWTRTRFGVDVHDQFGQTELGMAAGFAHHPELAIPTSPAAMGRALPGWTLSVLELDRDVIAAPGTIGRLAIDIADSPYFTFTGYGVDRDNPGDRFACGGTHFVTGDQASIDDEGIIRFSARDDDVILMAGYRIGPVDVESVLLAHPRVAEVAVVGAPDEVRGEVVHAYVVTDDGTTGPHPELATELQTWVKTRYAAHAYPRRVTFVDTLPKTPSGKVQRAKLRETARLEHAAS